MPVVPKLVPNVVWELVPRTDVIQLPYLGSLLTLLKSSVIDLLLVRLLRAHISANTLGSDPLLALNYSNIAMRKRI